MRIMGPCPASLRASGASVHQVSDLVAAGLCEEETIIGFSFGESHASRRKRKADPVFRLHGDMGPQLRKGPVAKTPGHQLLSHPLHDCPWGLGTQTPGALD